MWLALYLYKKRQITSFLNNPIRNQFLPDYEITITTMHIFQFNRSEKRGAFNLIMFEQICNEATKGTFVLKINITGSSLL